MFWFTVKGEFVCVIGQWPTQLILKIFVFHISCKWDFGLKLSVEKDSFLCHDEFFFNSVVHFFACIHKIVYHSQLWFQTFNPLNIMDTHRDKSLSDNKIIIISPYISGKVFQVKLYLNACISVYVFVFFVLLVLNVDATKNHCAQAHS